MRNHKTVTAIDYTVTIEEHETMKNNVANMVKRAIQRKDEKMFFNSSKEYYRRYKKEA